MHIPDGYLGPATCGFFYAVMLPIWALAAKIVKKTLQAKQVPLLAISAAFSFVIMMFNVPIPGGSTAHAVGGALLAILLGPWAACVAITVVLIIQALLLGDGGITAIGANSFNMALVMPFIGYYVYKAISYRSTRGSKRSILAAGVAGYVSITIAAILTGVECGSQPGYCPYGIKTAVAAMGGGHVLLFGWIEAVVTALVIKYLQGQGSDEI